MTTLTFNENQLQHLAGLLAGVAAADGDFDVFEADEIGDILAEIIRGDEIPRSVGQLIADFKYDEFNMAHACDSLQLVVQEERDAVLALIMRVAHSDDLADADENNYIVKVAEHLGAVLEEIDLDDVIEIVPPPLPPDASAIIPTFTRGGPPPIPKKES